jgi:hypothetical protein
VHRRCCVDGGAEGGAASPKAPREEVSPVVMEEAGGVRWGTGGGPKVGMEGGYVWGE